MTKIRTFIDALRTGETRTTKAIDRVLRSRGSSREELESAFRHRGALKAPLQDPFRGALRDAGLTPRYIERCIDRWPDGQKEDARRAVVSAINAGRGVRFRWGLTESGRFETEIATAGRGPITITARSPRSTLRVRGDEVEVAPSAGESRPRRRRSSGGGRR
jgi:hypothetical protein